MKILRNAVVWLWVCVALVGCRSRGANLPDYRVCDFRAEVRVELGEEPFYAEVLAEQDEGEAYAVLRHVRLLAPPALAGIELTVEEGAVVLARDGICEASAGAEAWWNACSLLCAEGVIRSVCEREWEGLPLDYAEISSGERVMGVYRDARTGIPKRICLDETVLTVIRWEETRARA